MEESRVCESQVSQLPLQKAPVKGEQAWHGPSGQLTLDSRTPLGLTPDLQGSRVASDIREAVGSEVLLQLL